MEKSIPLFRYPYQIKIIWAWRSRI